MIINQNNVGAQVLIEGNVQVNVVVHVGSARSDGWEQSNECAADGVDQETQVVAVEVKEERILETSTAENNEKEQIEKKFEEIIEKFCKKKVESLRVKDAYLALARKNKEERLVSKANRVEQCGTFLEFWIASDFLKRRLIHANFCRDRFCVMCMWRRSKKMYMQNTLCFDQLIKSGKFIFLTLTMKNVNGNELGQAVSRYSDAFRKMMRNKRVKKSMQGYLKNIETTYNRETKMYHPHMHVLFHVRNSYFNRDNYINQGEWKSLWEKCAGLNYSAQVHVKGIKSKSDGGVKGAIAEVSKYCLKFSSLDGLSDDDFVEVVGVLERELSGRRLTTYGGTWLEARRQMRMKDDIEDYEMDFDEESDPGWLILCNWIFGEGNYSCKKVGKVGKW